MRGWAGGRGSSAQWQVMYVYCMRVVRSALSHAQLSPQFAATCRMQAQVMYVYYMRVVRSALSHAQLSPQFAATCRMQAQRAAYNPHDVYGFHVLVHVHVPCSTRAAPHGAASSKQRSTRTLMRFAAPKRDFETRTFLACPAIDGGMMNEGRHVGLRRTRPWDRIGARQGHTPLWLPLFPLPSPVPIHRAMLTPSTTTGLSIGSGMPSLHCGRELELARKLCPLPRVLSRALARPLSHDGADAEDEPQMLGTLCDRGMALAGRVIICLLERSILLASASL